MTIKQIFDKKYIKHLFLIFNYLIPSILLNSCHYHQDILKVQNDTSSFICYETAVYSPTEKRFYLAPAGDSVPANEVKSPTVKVSIKDKLQSYEFDSTLYVYFLPCSLKSSFWSNTDLFIQNIDTSIVKCNKFSLSELDSMNWIIIYK